MQCDAVGQAGEPRLGSRGRETCSCLRAVGDAATVSIKPLSQHELAEVSPSSPWLTLSGGQLAPRVTARLYWAAQAFPGGQGGASTSIVLAELLCFMELVGRNL